MRTKNLILYNPLSNDGKAHRDWARLQSQNAQLFQLAFAVPDIKNLKQFLEDHNPEMITIAGGDGTINSICQAVLLLKKKPTIALLPLGFGNALSYCFGVENIENALAVITNPQNAVAIDIMQTNISKMPLGLFNIGVGFDGRIVHTRNATRYIGFPSYILSAFQNMMFHPHSEIVFTIDHSVTLSALASSLMVANGPIIGYNYVVAPDARLDDGLLDCTLFSTRYAYLTNFRLRGFKHPLYSRLGKVHFKASHIKIEGEPYVQIDGDPVQKKGIEISIAKKQLSFFYNKDSFLGQTKSSFIE